MTTSSVIDRVTAVDDLTAAIRGCTHYLIVTPPAAVATVAERLDGIPGWTAYVDSGTPVVLRTGLGTAVAMTAALTTSVAVILVPKSVPAATLTEVLGQDIPADGSQDLVLIHGPDGDPIVWPLLFLDAIGAVDPAAAAQIHAEAIR